MPKPFLLTLILAGSLAAQPSLVRLVAVADASADADMPSVNNGSAPLVTCGKNYTSTGTFRVWMTRGHFQFDLTPLAGLPTPTRVRLRVWQAQAAPAGCLDVTAHRITSPWSEGTLTWQNKPSHDPVVAATVCVGSNSDLGWKVFDVTAIGLAWLSNAQPNHGIVIRDPSEQTAGAARPLHASSREAANAAEHPQLEVAWDTRAYGVSCGPRHTPPSLDLEAGEPRIGTTYELAGRDFASGEALVHVLGGSDAIWNGTPLPLNLAPLGYAACHMYASPDVTIPAAANSRGRVQIQFPVPNLPYLRNKRVYHQIVSVDSNLVLSLTNGFAVRFF